jgi:AraC-like DNA-binding protein
VDLHKDDSVAAYFIQPMIHALGENTARIAKALEKSGIEPTAIQSPATRVPACAFATLWLNQISDLQDEFFGLDSHGMPPGSFALICRSLIQEPDLHKALRQCLKNFSLFLQDFRGTLTVNGKRALIRIESSAKDDAYERLGEETFLVLITSLLCWLGGHRIPILRADFRHTRLHLTDDNLLWGSDLNFGAKRTRIEFSSSYLQRPVVQDLASLKMFLSTAPQWLVVRFRNSQALASQIRQSFRGSVYDQWPTLQGFATAQHMSASTLRRRLEREGSSYQAIKNEVRLGVAIKQLRSSARSIGEIAELIGFQEISAFHRAFKKWTGESPGQYRKKAKMPDDHQKRTPPH